MTLKMCLVGLVKLEKVVVGGDAFLNRHCQPLYP
jgi:hypothetical protein